jgi:hypothetical protein
MTGVNHWCPAYFCHIGDILKFRSLFVDRLTGTLNLTCLATRYSLPESSLCGERHHTPLLPREKAGVFPDVPQHWDWARLGSDPAHRSSWPVLSATSWTQPILSFHPLM